LASATGISGGAAFTIPALFFPGFMGQQKPLSRLKDLKIEKIEKVGGQDCYVITASSLVSKREVFWISKTDYVIRKYYRSFESPKAGPPIPEMTDQELEETLEALGQEATEENKKHMREMLKRSAETLKTMKLKGGSTETHIDISFPELDKKDFKFTPPPNAVLKKTLFGGIFETPCPRNTKGRGRGRALGAPLLHSHHSQPSP